MMTDYQLINAEQLRRFRMDHPHLDDVDLMAQLSMELAQQLHRIEAQRRMATNKEENPLQRFASLRPTHDQIRTALLRLLEMPCPTDSSKPLLWQKQHWLAVMRVLQFLGIIGTDYGSRQNFVAYINCLMGKRFHPIAASSIKRIDSERPFNRPLQEWYGKLHAERTKYYWDISMIFLECMSEANRSNFCAN